MYIITVHQNYMEQKLPVMKGEFSNSTIVVGYLNSSLSIIARTTAGRWAGKVQQHSREI